ncbi:MAG: single-stranded-DNA-specific exonuclease RecJ [Candidatus Omnitrophica bacterium]|nr:single-stranded-DNA-specific exonuclease RecJ [Candidatus Omnitrophota bacterium]
MKWCIREVDKQLLSYFSNEINLHPLIATLLINRNIKDKDEAEIFLASQISQLSDPHKIKGVDKALERIKIAKEKAEKVFIFGDYDVDGISACALLESSLKKLGIETVVYLPHRMEEGYGLNMKAVNEAKALKARLFISVDCGIGSFEEIEKLNSYKIDSIIIDHHQPKSKKLPKAVAIINPKVNKNEANLSSLAAVGLVFKLVQALFDSNLEEDLDFVALGTICDVVPLIGENRIFVKEGLKRISQTKRVGIRALKEVAGIKDRKITAGLIGFTLGPRLNASGRIDSAQKSLKLLTCSDEAEAMLLAKGLNEANRKRQRIEDKILKEALTKVEREVNFKEHSVIVVGGDDWHPGVVGIIASKLANRYYRPAFVLGLETGVYRGSGRSINNFHLFEALSECDSLLESYGGHRGAAGLKLLEKDLEEFRKSINAVAKAKLKPEDLVPILNIDAEVDLSLWQDRQLIDRIEEFAPFGIGNPRPVFCSRNLFLKSAPLAIGKRSLRFWVSDGSFTAKAIGFGMAEYANLLNENSRIDLAYSVSIDTWGEPVVQLEIKAIKERI